MMRYFQLIILILVLNSCNSNKIHISKEQSPVFNKNQLSYIYSFIVDDFITEPSIYDIYPLLNSSFDMAKGYILVSKNNVDAVFFNRLIGSFTRYLDTSLDIVPLENTFSSTLITTSQFQIVSGDFSSERQELELMKEDCLMVIGFSKFQIIDKHYFIYITGRRKFEEIEDVYGIGRLYEFEKCNNGIINFLSSYEPFGCCDDNGKPRFFKRKIGKGNCE